MLTGEQAAILFYTYVLEGELHVRIITGGQVLEWVLSAAEVTQLEGTIATLHHWQRMREGTA